MGNSATNRQLCTEAAEEERTTYRKRIRTQPIRHVDRCLAVRSEDGGVQIFLQCRVVALALAVAGPGAATADWCSRWRSWRLLRNLKVLREHFRLGTYRQSPTGQRW